MAEEKIKMTLMKKWFDDIIDDPNQDLTEQDMAYITYAAVRYGLYQEKINIKEKFGRDLNLAMPNIYGQIDNIKGFSENRNVKYDSEAIKELRLKGCTAKEVCAELGYPEDKARSITSNKGWIEAGKMLKNMDRPVQKSTESVQSKNKIISIKGTENTDSVQKYTEISQTENTEKDRSVQNALEKFDF